MVCFRIPACILHHSLDQRGWKGRVETARNNLAHDGYIESTCCCVQAKFLGMGTKYSFPYYGIYSVICNHVFKALNKFLNKSSNFVRGHLFRHLNCEFLSSPAWSNTQDIKKFQKQTLLQIFFSFDVVWCQKVVNMMFFEDLYFVRFCDEINF